MSPQHVSRRTIPSHLVSSHFDARRQPRTPYLRASALAQDCSFLLEQPLRPLETRRGLQPIDINCLLASVNCWQARQRVAGHEEPKFWELLPLSDRCTDPLCRLIRGSTVRQRFSQEAVFGKHFQVQGNTILAVARFYSFVVRLSGNTALALTPLG